eukprot:TRINITY_DN70_c0_g1_i2.p1 TRINITY_DN70_c0_g1~~TRINITY_DN70_c0_g1_i2.p1  ORF type:complete len:721 (-),score=332.61 TRINITY_DN70_c0_g1_i2:89-2251(-)
MDRTDTLKMDTSAVDLDATLDLDAPPLPPAADARWGRLVPTHDAPQLDLKGVQTVLGRSNECDVHVDDKRCSKRHACVAWDAAAGRASVEDLSTNGTYVNGEKVGKGNTRALKNYDEIVLVRAKKDGGDDAVGFVFVLKLSKSETGSFHPDPLARTTPKKAVGPEADNKGDGAGDGAQDDANANANANANASADDVEQQRPVKRARTEESGKQPEDEKKTDEKKSEDGGADAEAKKPDGDEKPAAAASDPKADAPAPAAPAPAAGDGGDDDDDDEPERTAYEENMTCPICDDLLYQCVSILPCMHSYCAACWSDWAKRSNSCPSCRVTATEVRRNHQLNNLVTEYIKAHPGKKRSDEEIKEMDARNTITAESLRVQAPTNHGYDSDGSYDDGYGSSSDEVTPRCYECPPPAPGANGAGAQLDPAALAALAAADAAARVVPGITAQRTCDVTQLDHERCRFCVTYVPLRADLVAGNVPRPPQPVNPNALPATPIAFNLAAGGAGPSAGNDPSAAAAAATAAAAAGPVVLDPADPDPAKRPPHWQTGGLDPASESYIRPQRCGMCGSGPFCTSYFPATAASLPQHVALRRIRDQKPAVIPGLALAENRFERKVLTDYIAAKGISLADIVTKYADRVGVAPTGPDDWHMIGWHGLHADQKICPTCFTRVFADMLVAFRMDIPKAELPDEIARRRDCWYGWTCRTMRHNIDHAKRMNHFCKTTR